MADQYKDDKESGHTISTFPAVPPIDQSIYSTNESAKNVPLSSEILTSDQDQETEDPWEKSFHFTRSLFQGDLMRNELLMMEEMQRLGNQFFGKKPSSNDDVIKPPSSSDVATAGVNKFIKDLARENAEAVFARIFYRNTENDDQETCKIPEDNFVMDTPKLFGDSKESIPVDLNQASGIEQIKRT